MISPQHGYEVRHRKDHRGVDLISDALPFGGLWYAGSNAASNAVSYANFYSRSQRAVIRVYDEAGNVIDPLGFTCRLRSANQQLLRCRASVTSFALAPST